MTKIIACIDGSLYADSVCALSAWASDYANFDISLLHVITPYSDRSDIGDLSGQIGLGAKSGLLKELSDMDEEQGKIEQKKGKLMLEHAKDELSLKGIYQVETLHRYGSLVETISDLEKEIEIVVIGKRGEDANSASNHLGSNLERVVRSIHKPILVASAVVREISSFVIAYDGSPSIQKAVDYAINNPLLKGLECHLLKVSPNPSKKEESALAEVEEKLQSAGFNVHSQVKQGKHLSESVNEYIDENKIDLLVIGAYGHSQIRNLILGSTTTSLIRESDVPLMLFR